MDGVTGISLRAMQHDVSRLERISNNLANTLTPGYRREVAVQRAGANASTASMFANAMETMVSTVVQDAPGNRAETKILRDTRSGSLRTTGQALDLALTGRGFFEVATSSGPAYTRHGQFQLDARARLVTAQGHAVMGMSGELTLAPGSFAIDNNGTLTQSGRTIGQLKVVDFDNASGLQQIEGGLFAAGRNATALDSTEIQVRQGFLENANVSSAHEMVELMQTMRHFESMHRVIQSYDDMLGSAMRRLGEI
jgi:flagellar basal-body rod protein FlgF